MTCEVAILNKNGIALAADSAMTVSNKINGENKPRYFKGSNKIFQLSHYNPVGLMIYGTASVQTIPLEIVIKEYRKVLGRKSFSRLQDYADDFYRFVSSNKEIYPIEIREKYISYYSGQFWEERIKGVVLLDAYMSAPDDKTKMDVIADAFSGFVAEVSAIPHDKCIPEPQAKKIIEKFMPQVAKDIQNYLVEHRMPMVDCSLLARASVEFVCKRCKVIRETGMVFAGYGEKDYCPQYIQYEYGGNIDNCPVVEKKSDFRVDFTKPSDIKCFARQEMITTFMYGMSDDIFSECIKFCDQALSEFASKLGIATDDATRLIIDKQKEEFGNKCFAHVNTNHYVPLKSVIESLPFSEMADLAETLVALESLKEKVSQNSESVGGPVDVAIISKGDGFVWIKRKHYFDKSINSRYIALQRDIYGKKS